MEDSDDTAVVAEKVKTAPNWTSRILAFLAGACMAVGPAVATGWYGVKQAKIEATSVREASKKEASTGYETLAGPLEEFRSAIAILDWRVQRLEGEQSSKTSTQPISPQPLIEPALKKRVPQTLMEADMAAASEKKE